MSQDHDEPHEHQEPQFPESAALRASALEAILIEQGLLRASAIDDVIAQYTERTGPMNGARVVAKAWSTPEFKAALLADGTSAIAPFNFCCGEHAAGAQRGGVHVVFLLPLGGPWVAAGLVQGPGVSLPHCSRTA